MKDKCFKAAHRGGPLDAHRHRLFATWATDCMEHVLPLLIAKYPQDDRTWRVIEMARA